MQKAWATILSYEPDYNIGEPVYLASDVDALLHRIEVEARQQSPFTMANIVRLIIQARNNNVLMERST